MSIDIDALTWQPLGASSPTLEAIDLKIAPAERVLIAGVSGAGKSTLLRALAGVLEEQTPGQLAGTIRIADRPADAGRADVGLIQQQPFDSVVAETVGRDVAFGPENLGLAREEIRERVAEALRLVGFPYGQDHDTAELSGGQAQRLAIAGVLALRPAVLLLDEPVSMLDAAAATEVRSAIGSVLDRTAASLVVADHDIAGWSGIVERLVVLDGGRLRFDGPIGAIVEAHQDELLALGLWVPGAPPPKPAPVNLPPIATPAELCGSDLAVSRRPALTLRMVPRRPRLVVEDQTIDVSPGSFVALRGASGAGKSTLIAALLGLLPTDAGTVELTGFPETPSAWTSRDLASRVGWVPQFGEALVKGNTVLESLLATADALGHPRTESEPRGCELLTALGLESLTQRHPLSLSGGEQRRLAVASALLHSPAFVAADEPTVGLDRHCWAAVVGLLAAHRAANGGVLVATHDEALAAQANRQLCLPPPRPAKPEPVSTGRGLLSRAGPLSLLLGVVLLTIGGLAASELLPLAFACGTMLVTGAALAGWRFPLGRLFPAGIALVSVAWSNWILASPPSIGPALVAALRVGFVVIPGIVAATYLAPTTLGDHLGGRLHLPARPVLAMVAALRRLGEFAALWQELAQGRRVRGLGPGKGPVARVRHWSGMCFALLVETVRRAGRLAVAMDSRGYSAPGRRTWLGEAPWKPADTVVVAWSAVLAALPHLLALVI